MKNIMDELFNGCPRIDTYRACVFPDLFPNERQPVLQNWNDEDLAAFCGGEFTVRTEASGVHGDR